MARLLAKPQSRKAAIALPIALANIIQGYGNRSLRYPMRIWPATPAMLNIAKTIVAESGDEMVVVKTAIYKETGKYDMACRKLVTDYRS